MAETKPERIWIDDSGQDRTFWNDNGDATGTAEYISIEAHNAAVEAARKEAVRNFRWAYQLLLALAKRRLVEANANREAENDWPAGQEWYEMAGSSHSIFLRGAREEAGIPEDVFMGLIRALEYDIEDLYEAAAKNTKPPQHSGQARKERVDNAKDLAEGLTSQLFEVEGFGDYTNSQQREGVYDLVLRTLNLLLDAQPDGYAQAIDAAKGVITMYRDAPMPTPVQELASAIRALAAPKLDDEVSESKLRKI